ncbi:MAG: DUF2163 domain-containing protein [Litorimonas sp.]
MSEVTTLCSLWRLDFAVRSSIFLTDHDDVILYDGETYIPQNAAEARLTESRTGLSVDSGGIRTVLTLPDISAQDIRDGVLDNAQLSQFQHDWRSGETDLLVKGRIGDVSFSGDEISVEWLGQASLLDQSTGRVFSRQCDASFGDARCGLNKADFADGIICPRSFAACRDQFANTVNFRGFPYLLGDDVLQSGVGDSNIRDGSSRYK